MGKLTKIEAKPEQSKHLETATANVCGLSVDWVQQRGQEVYSPGSRIPTVASSLPALITCQPSKLMSVSSESAGLWNSSRRR